MICTQRGKSLTEFQGSLQQFSIVTDPQCSADSSLEPWETEETDTGDWGWGQPGPSLSQLRQLLLPDQCSVCLCDSWSVKLILDMVNLWRVDDSSLPLADETVFVKLMLSVYI